LPGAHQRTPTHNRSGAQTMALQPTAANVLRIFREGTAEDVTTGRAWYQRAHDACQEVAQQYGTDVETVAAVYAVISPSMQWARNDFLAREAFRLADEGASFDDIVDGLGMMKSNARKAAAIVLGADPLSVVSGPKVVPFWHRIVDAANGATGVGSVVVDRHAFDIAVGMVTDQRQRTLFLGRKGGHHTVAMCYMRAASVLRRTGECPDITPAELQAVTWVVWRREHAHAQGKAAARRDAAAALTAV
jgi:hypothetical protein